MNNNNTPLLNKTEYIIAYLYFFFINIKQHTIIYMYIHISAYTKLLYVFKEKYIQNNILKYSLNFYDFYEIRKI